MYGLVLRLPEVVVVPTLRVIHRNSVFVGRELTLQESVVKFGREPACDVLFDEVADRSVSRNHAEVRWEASGPVLYPANGKIVLIRNQPINVPTLLRSGDVLEFSGPGGPAVEVQFDLAPQVGKPADDVDPVAATVFEMNPAALAAMANNAPANPTPPVVNVAPPPPPPAPPPPAPKREAVNLPEMPAPAPRPPPMEEKGGTAFIPAIDAAALAQFDKKQAPVPVQTRSRRNLVVAVVVGAVVLSLAGIGAAWWSAKERAERIHLAVERVEALIAAEESAGVVPEVSEEDMRLFEAEVKANRHLAPAVPIRSIKKKVAVKAPSVDSRPDEKPAAEVVPKRTAVREAFALYQRAQIERLAEGHPKDTAHLKELIAAVKKAEAAYEEVAKALPPPSGDATDVLLRSVVRHLGECDALMPERFRVQARQAIEAMQNDKAKHDRLVSGLKRAADFRYAPTITAALADQGLPVELFFIPLRASGFDERRVDLPNPRGIPKGMWALLPGPADDMGLHVGKAKESLDADPTDERQHYEREVKRVAKSMRLVFLKKAAGSSLLFMSTWDHGDTELLSKMKEKAGLEPMESDPEKVNFWKLWESGKLTDDVKFAALEYVAMATIGEKPDQFGFSFPPPLEHVSLADSE
jgi:hypothetical protein